MASESLKKQTKTMGMNHFYTKGYDLRVSSYIWADEFPYPSLKSKRVRQSEWLKSLISLDDLNVSSRRGIPEVDF